METKRNPPLDGQPCHHSYLGVCEKRQILDDNCSSICRADWRPVYGSDGNTYSNECRLNYASCMNPSDNIVVARKGKCHGNCSGFCWAHYSPVCGSDGNTYSNECRLNYASCMNPSDNIVVAHKGKCLHPGTCPPSHKECTDAHKGLSIHIPQICSDDAECRFYSKCCFDKCLDHHTCKPAQDFAFGIFTGNKDTIALSIDRK
ncbi:unnamed protein product [Meganyctiphanes norvegica]|uniref:Kazal-like domain-containing protein n=1 Tax=Meganyctiphanes norvegica TaxID=48144 RepID=A0AAV2RMZ6_MEGNR